MSAERDARGASERELHRVPTGLVVDVRVPAESLAVPRLRHHHLHEGSHYLMLCDLAPLQCVSEEPGRPRSSFAHVYPVAAGSTFGRKRLSRLDLARLLQHHDC